MIKKKRIYTKGRISSYCPMVSLALSACGSGELGFEEAVIVSPEIDLQLSARAVSTSSIGDFLFDESGETAKLIYSYMDFDIDGDDDIVSYNKNVNTLNYLENNNGYYQENNSQLSMINSLILPGDSSDNTKVKMIISFDVFDINGDNKDDFVILQNKNFGNELKANDQEFKIQLNLQSIPGSSVVQSLSEKITSEQITQAQELINATYNNNFSKDTSVSTWRDPLTDALGFLLVENNSIGYFPFVDTVFEKMESGNNPFRNIVPSDNYIAKTFRLSNKEFLSLSGDGNMRLFVYSNGVFSELSSSDNPFYGDTNISSVAFTQSQNDISKNLLTAQVSYTDNTMIAYQLTLENDNRISRQLWNDPENYLYNISQSDLIDFFYLDLNDQGVSKHLVSVFGNQDRHVSSYESQSSNYVVDNANTSLKNAILSHSQSAVSLTSFKRDDAHIIAIANSDGSIGFFNIEGSGLVNLYNFHTFKEGITKIDINSLTFDSDDFAMVVSYDDGYVEMYKIVFDSASIKKDFITETSYFADFIKIYSEKLSDASVKSVFIESDYKKNPQGDKLSYENDGKRGMVVLDTSESKNQLRYFANIHGEFFENKGFFNPYDGQGKKVYNIAAQKSDKEEQAQEELSIYRDDGSFHVLSSEQIKKVTTQVFSATLNENSSNSVILSLSNQVENYDISSHYTNAGMSDLYNISISANSEIIISLNPESNILAHLDPEDNVYDLYGYGVDSHPGLYFKITDKSGTNENVGHIYVDIDVKGSIDYGIPSRLGTAIISSNFVIETTQENKNLLESFWHRTTSNDSKMGTKHGTAELGKAIQITYSVASKNSYYEYTAASANFNDIARSVDVTLTQEQQNIFETLVDEVVKLLTNICGIEFIKVEDTLDTIISPGKFGDIRFAFSSSSELGNNIAGAIDPNTISGYHASGDIWLNNQYLDDFMSTKKGDIFYNTLLHELGHAVGLRHLHYEENDAGITDNTVREQNYDGMPYSVMSYKTYVNADHFSGENNTASYTYMRDDITALQHVYGKNTVYASGDDVYDFDDVAFIYETIWDTGGYDTIDWSDKNSRAIINLSDGSFSYFGRVNSVSDEVLSYLGRTNIISNSASTITKEGIFAIAKDVTIERAIGGNASDYIFGNEVENKLYGGSGDDVLWGGGGKDILYGGTGRDYFYFRGADATSNKNDVDVIKDFSVQNDKILLRNMSFNLLKKTHIVDDNHSVLGTMISVSASDTHLVFIEGVEESELTSDNFYNDNILDLEFITYGLL